MSRTDPARELLFGLLAFQNNFIDRPALLNAFAEWVADKSRAIGDVLEAQGTLSAPPRAAIDALIAVSDRRAGTVRSSRPPSRGWGDFKNNSQIPRRIWRKTPYR